MMVKRHIARRKYGLLTSLDTALRRIIETITHRNTTKNMELIKLNQSMKRDQSLPRSIGLITTYGFWDRRYGDNCPNALPGPP